jgi:hypothetical protein
LLGIAWPNTNKDKPVELDFLLATATKMQGASNAKYGRGRMDSPIWAA